MAEEKTLLPSKSSQFHEEKVETDSFFFTSLFVTEFSSSFLKMVQTILGTSSPELNCGGKLCRLFILFIYIIFSSFCIVIGLLPFGIQIICCQQIASYLEEQVEITKANATLFTLRCFLIFILDCQLFEELTCAVINSHYLFKEFKSFSFIHKTIICIPQMCQILITYTLSFYALNLILITDDSVVDIIQNFAGLYVILQFDNIVYKLLQNLKIIDFIKELKTNNSLLKLQETSLKISEILGNEDKKVNAKYAWIINCFLLLPLIGLSIIIIYND